MLVRAIFLITLVMLGTACDQKPLNPRLWKIGTTNERFQMVLDHYSPPRDSLKLRAAEFLIENLNNHFHYHPKNGDEMDTFFRNLDREMDMDSIKRTELYWQMREVFMDEAVAKALSDGTIKKPVYVKRLDVRTITPEYLIENIDYAFKAWGFPWAQSYTFDQFCTYILPYRYGNEPISFWRKELYERFKWVADSLDNPTDPMEAAFLLSEQFTYEISGSPELVSNGFKLKITNQLDAMLIGNCVDWAGLGVCVLRSLGILSAIIRIPKWGDTYDGHNACGVLDLDNNWRFMNFSETGPDTKHVHRPPKMLLHQFDKMERFKPVPIDVSEKAMKVMDLEVDINAKKNDEIFLCVFGDRAWTPIWKGENLQSKAIFKNIGKKECAYIVAVKRQGRLKAVSDAFIPDTSGNITYYQPNTSKLSKIELSRKSPKRGWLGDIPFFNKAEKRINDLVGGAFSVSESKDFEHAMQLYEVDSTIKYHHNIIKIKRQESRYFKYQFPESQKSSFDGPAEIAFYTTNNDTLQKINGRIYGSPQISSEHIRLVTDDDQLTYVEIWDCPRDIERRTNNFILRRDKEPLWIAMEVDTPTAVTHVGICPRNDKNGIYEGMKYELLYWDNSWISLGKKIATGDSIAFAGIPEGALLWLRNLDEGEEERIFTIKDGEQVWW